MPEGNKYSTGHLDSRDIVSGFGPALEVAMGSIWAMKLGTVVQSDRGEVDYAWLGQVPVMRRWIGGRHEEILKKYTHTVRSYPYEVTLPISVPDLRRDMTGLLRQRVADLARRTATHWDKIASEWIDASDAGTLGLGYDGQFLFDTDHNESGSNQTNDLTATEVPAANVVDPEAPTVTEASNIINQTLGRMTGLTDDQGEPINVEPTNVIIQVTKPSHFSAFQGAVGLNTFVGGVENPLLPVIRSGWSFTVVNNTRLTDANNIKFFLGDPGTTNGPLVFVESQPVTAQLIGAGSEEEFKNNRHLFGVTADRGVGYGRWQGAAMVTLS